MPEAISTNRDEVRASATPVGKIGTFHPAIQHLIKVTNKKPVKGSGTACEKTTAIVCDSPFQIV
jgi:hypothetical protein